MRVLIKRATIIAPSSPFNGQVKDIFVQDGHITSIADQINDAADQSIDHDNLHVSIGWMDSFAHFCDPGFEYRETLESGSLAAAAGGFTTVMTVPNTSPVVQTKAQVEYIVQRNPSSVVTIHPLAAISKNAEGKQLAEMYDMANSGAIAFSDGLNAVQDAGLLLKALQYVKTVDGTVVQLPDDHSIGSNGLMNEGIISTRLGLPGKPAIGEELMVARDIELARHAASKLHFTGISTAKSLARIRAAKAEGVRVSCSVAPYHLFFSDEDLQEYDTNLKLNPPLRTSEDRDALVAGLLDGTVDFIASHHLPQNYDGKVCEFEYAKNGMIGLESLFSVACSVMNRDGFWNLEQLIACLGIAPRKQFGLAVPEIKPDVPANLALFDPGSEYVFDQSHIRSKSNNSAFLGRKLKGRVIGVLHGNKIHLN